MAGGPRAAESTWSAGEAAGCRALRLGPRGRRTRDGVRRSSTRMELKPVRVAAVGCGYWGPNVIRNLDAISGFELCCVCDADPNRLKPVAVRYPSAASTTDVEEIFDDRSVDALYISTPVSTHYLLVKRALESGKHVLVEKPLATTVDQAQELGQHATDYGRTLM